MLLDQFVKFGLFGNKGIQVNVHLDCCVSFVLLLELTDFDSHLTVDERNGVVFGNALSELVGSLLGTERQVPVLVFISRFQFAGKNVAE